LSSPELWAHEVHGVSEREARREAVMIMTTGGKSTERRKKDAEIERTNGRD
jgi:hypothetical protein